MSGVDVAGPAPEELGQVDVLLVDDDEGIHFLVARHLRRAGVSLAWCQHGQAAHEFLRANAVTLLLLDQRLPDCMGDELLARLVTEGLLDDTRVSICTSQRPAPDICQRIVACGADVLPKSDILSREGLRSMLSKASSECGHFEPRDDTGDDDGER